MSLHCPATLLIVTPEAAARLAPEALDGRRVAAVHVAAQPVCEAAALGLAARLDVPVTRGADVSSIDPGRSRDALEAIADLHRGETVLLVATPHLFGQLPRLALDRRAPGAAALHGVGATVLECGDDGWSVLPVSAATTTRGG